jgi:dimeric dUTPase (all-alpha-NTP-PPase superfamily)
MLDLIFEKQKALQVRSYGGDPAELPDEERIAYVRNMTLALEDELHEALAETGWKPWATSRHINREAYVGELVDALHFLVNLFLVVGAGADEVHARYIEKSTRNAKRQSDGYDGLAGKCTSCRAALDDAGVTCTPTLCSKYVFASAK